MLVSPCEGRHLLDLGGRDVTRINPANTASFHVYFEHGLRGLFSVHRKILLQHFDDELHRREVIVEENDRVKRGRCELAALGLKDRAGLMLFCHASILTSLGQCAKPASVRAFYIKTTVPSQRRKKMLDASSGTSVQMLHVLVQVFL